MLAEINEPPGVIEIMTMTARRWQWWEVLGKLLIQSLHGDGNSKRSVCGDKTWQTSRQLKDDDRRRLLDGISAKRRSRSISRCRAAKRSVGNLTMTASSSLIRSGARNHAVGEVQWREPRDEGRRSTELERWGPSDWIGLTGAAIRGEHWRDESVDQGQVNRQCNWSPNNASWGPWTNRRYSCNFLKIYLK